VPQPALSRAHARGIARQCQPVGAMRTLGACSRAASTTQLMFGPRARARPETRPHLLSVDSRGGRLSVSAISALTLARTYVRARERGTPVHAAAVGPEEVARAAPTPRVAPQTLRARDADSVLPDRKRPGDEANDSPRSRSRARACTRERAARSSSLSSPPMTPRGETLFQSLPVAPNGAVRIRSCTRRCVRADGCAAGAGTGCPVRGARRKS
jgi:hypothetical protein